MARPRKNQPEQAPDAVQIPVNEAPIVDIEPAPKAEALPSLKEFVAQHEDKAQETGAVVTRITYPGAETHIRQGRYSGIHITDGKPVAIYSDGSKH